MMDKDSHKIKYFTLGIILGFLVMFYGIISNNNVFIIGIGIVVMGIDVVLLPFTTPFFVRGFLAGGIKVLVMLLLLLVVNIIIYYPFFKIADKKACEEEQAALEAEKGELNEAQ